MPKSGKKAERGAYRFSKDELSRDFTPNDLPNSGRKKKDKILVDKLLKKVTKLNVNENDFVIDNDENMSIKKSNSNKVKPPLTSVALDDHSGIDYPIDIWFLISEFLHPEDVGTFAGICKTTLAVVSTAEFWSNLYKRYYREVESLPKMFQPEHMAQRYGLRARVIRALHFMYPPFVSKVQQRVLIDGDLHRLTKWQCIVAWYKKIKNHWLFYFKLKQPDQENESNNNHTKPNLIELLEDITVNVDNNCKILKVTCLNYIQIPMLSGQILKRVSLNITNRMTSYKLELNFDSGSSPYLSNCDSMVFEPVVNVRVLDWWDPFFPNSDHTSTRLISSEFSSENFLDSLE